MNWPAAHADIGLTAVAFLVVMLAGEIVYIVRNR